MALSNAQYDAVMREYEKRRLAAVHKAEERAELVELRLPRLKEIRDEMSSSAADAVRKSIAGDTKAVASFEKRCAELETERLGLLKSNGIEPDYDKPVYSCPLCSDTGYVGDYSDKKRCKCLNAAIVEYLYRDSNLTGYANGASFENFSLDYYRNDEQLDNGRTEYDHMKRIYDRAVRFVDEFDEKHANLMFMGDVGTGKTYMSGCIAVGLIEKHIPVLYLSASDFFNRLNERRFSHDDEYGDDDLIDECELLIIDDLGSEVTNERMNSDFFNCLNMRMAKGLSTIISSNLELGEFESRYSARIYSRISTGFEFFRFVGRDIRWLKKK